MSRLHADSSAGGINVPASPPAIPLFYNDLALAHHQSGCQHRVLLPQWHAACFLALSARRFRHDLHPLGISGFNKDMVQESPSRYAPRQR